MSATHLLVLLTLLTACRPRSSPSDDALPSSSVPQANTSPKAHPRIALPLVLEDAPLVSSWRSLILAAPGTESAEEQIPLFAEPSDSSPLPRHAWIETRRSPLPTGWRVSNSSWYQESGSIYRMILSPGSGTQDVWTWVRILREVLFLVESPELSMPFRPSLKLVTQNDASIPRSRLLPLGRFIEIQPSAASSPLAREACDTFRRWFAARQLLMGRSLKAVNRNREALVLHCDFTRLDETIRATAYLQIAELPLPIQDPRRKEILFRSPSDLIRWDKLRRLPPEEDTSP